MVLLLALLWLASPVCAQDSSAKLVLVTLDGVRWQEIFGGVDASLLADARYTHEPEALRAQYWHERRAERRQRLFPFLWTVVASRGVLVGDRTAGSFMEVTNPWWFSYPGYNEILTGRADRRIDSNDKFWNPNVTFLEVLNQRRDFKDRVQAFTSWDVFPYILNSERSGLPVNAGFSIAAPAITAKSRWLNEVSDTAPRLWPSVREDFITNGYAMEALEHRSARVTYIALGETDDFAHDGSYDRYIDAAHRADLMLGRLWQQLQADRYYRDRTTLLISTDHGRGNTPDGWPHHASPAATAKLGISDAPEGVSGSDEIWLAAIGPAVQSSGLLQGRWKQSQIAATALAALRLDPHELMPQADPPMEQLLR